MKIALFGGTAMVGKFIIEEALQRGIEVKLLARSPEKLGALQSQVEVVKGDYFNAQDVEKTLQGVDMVVSAIGPPPGRPKNVTADMYAQAMKNLINSMNNHGIKRIVNIAGAGTSYPGEKIVFGRHMLRMLLILFAPLFTPAKEAELKALMDSELDYTTVRPPMILQKEIKGEFAVSEDQFLGSKVYVKDLVKFILDSLENPSWHRTKPFVGVN